MDSLGSLCVPNDLCPLMEVGSHGSTVDHFANFDHLEPTTHRQTHEFEDICGEPSLSKKIETTILLLISHIFMILILLRIQISLS